MSLKDQLLKLVENSRAEELKFISSLSDAERAFEGRCRVGLRFLRGAHERYS